MKIFTLIFVLLTAESISAQTPLKVLQALEATVSTVILPGSSADNFNNYMNAAKNFSDKLLGLMNTLLNRFYRCPDATLISTIYTTAGLNFDTCDNTALSQLSPGAISNFNLTTFISSSYNFGSALVVNATACVAAFAVNVPAGVTCATTMGLNILSASLGSTSGTPPATVAATYTTCIKAVTSTKAASFNTTLPTCTKLFL